MSENCCNEPGRPHNWDLWRPVSEMRRGDGSNPYWYRRTCQMLGCAAIEETENLVPKGKHLLKEGYEAVVDRAALKIETVWTGEQVTVK